MRKRPSELHSGQQAYGISWLGAFGHGGRLGADRAGAMRRAIQGKGSLLAREGRSGKATLLDGAYKCR